MNKTEPFYGQLVMCHVHCEPRGETQIVPSIKYGAWPTAGSQLMLAEGMHQHVPLVAFTDGVP